MHMSLGPDRADHMFRIQAHGERSDNQAIFAISIETKRYYLQREYKSNREAWWLDVSLAMLSSRLLRTFNCN